MGVRVRLSLAGVGWSWIGAVTISVTFPRLQGSLGSKSHCKSLKTMARPERFELPTYGFEVRRSIQLSYGRASLSYNSLRRATSTHPAFAAI